MFTVIDVDTNRKARHSRFSSPQEAFDFGYAWARGRTGADEWPADFVVLDPSLKPLPYRRMAALVAA